MAEQYVVDRIESVFPEICTAIQLRRAKFTIINTQYNKLKNMVHNGQIEEKDADFLKEELEHKLYEMSSNPPEVQFDFQPVRIVKYSDLSSIFTRDQLSNYTDLNLFEEIMFEPK